MLLSGLALALIAATAAAFAFTESLKLERLPVVGPRFPESFSPVCVCPSEVARLGLRFRVTDTVELSILDADEEVVRSLGKRRVRPGIVFFEWDGRGDDGRIVEDGPYRLRVQLDGKRRTIVIPNEIFVDTVPPTVELLGGRPAAFSPDGDGVADEVTVRYQADGPAGPILYVGDDVALERPPRRARSSVLWDGSVGDELQPPDSYRLSVRVRDPAGNLSPRSEKFTVELRYVMLSASEFRVRRGGILVFGVDTDASQFDWRLQRLRGGKPRKVVRTGDGRDDRVQVRLGRGVPPGRYRLEVYLRGENPQRLPKTDSALVIVTRR